MGLDIFDPFIISILEEDSDGDVQTKPYLRQGFQYERCIEPISRLDGVDHCIKNVVIEQISGGGCHGDIVQLSILVVDSADICFSWLLRGSEGIFNLGLDIELGPRDVDMIFVVGSDDLGDIGFVYLPRQELEVLKISEQTNDSHRKPIVIRAFTTPEETNIAFRMIFSVQKTEAQDIEEDPDQHYAYVTGISDDISEKPRLLNESGELFMTRFEKTRNEDDIDKAINAYEAAVRLISPEHRGYVICMYDVAIALRKRSTVARDKRTTDIPQAIEKLTWIIRNTPDNHPDLGERLLNLGLCFLHTFQCTGDLLDYKKTVSPLKRFLRVTHNDVNTPSCLDALATALACRFNITGQINDISAAISVRQNITKLIPETHADMPRLLSHLGISLSSRFGHTANFEDISEAILLQQKSIALITPLEDHPLLPVLSLNLGNSYQSRYEFTHDVVDLSNAISLQERAIRLTSRNDPIMPALQISLGTSYTHRFRQTRKPEDISVAISAQRLAIELAPDDLVNMPAWLSNMGDSFRTLFQETREQSDVSEAIRLHRLAVEITPLENPSRPIYLHNLGLSLTCLHDLTKSISDISKTICVQEDCVKSTHTDDPARPEFLRHLGNSFFTRFMLQKNDPDIYMAISNFEMGSTQMSGLAPARFNCAQAWAQASLLLDPSMSLNAYDIGISLMSQIAGLEQTVRKRKVNISNFTTIAAAAAFSMGEIQKALEWLEQGRCLIWGQLNELRNPLRELVAYDPILANDLLSILRALEVLGSREEIAVTQSLSYQSGLEKGTRAAVKYAQERERLLKKIRDIPHFRNFLCPPLASELLQTLPPSGTVIVINVSQDRCDAMVILPGRDRPPLIHIHLENFGHELAEEMSLEIGDYLYSKGARMGDVGQEKNEVDRDDRDRALRRGRRSRDKTILCDILSKLWRWVVKPIFDRLEWHPIGPRPRVWWCTTGPLTSLPIHAAGEYNREENEHAVCVSDYVISSYTPSVGALSENRNIPSPSKTPKDKGTQNKILLVSQPNTPGLLPIPKTKEETDSVSGIMKAAKFTVLCLEDKNGTVDRVKSKMGSHSWVHFACHASQIARNPLESRFYLYDGRLDLAEIMKIKIPHAGLAFLSACQTSTGDTNTSEEAVHLAAGMLSAGYKDVIGTMWSISDRYGPEVAGEFYRHLLEAAPGGEGGESKKLDSTRAAYALDHAIRHIRKILGDTEDALLKWVPYVHFGR